MLQDNNTLSTLEPTNACTSKICKAYIQVQLGLLSHQSVTFVSLQCPMIRLNIFTTDDNTRGLAPSTPLEYAIPAPSKAATMTRDVYLTLFNEGLSPLTRRSLLTSTLYSMASMVASMRVDDLLAPQIMPIRTLRLIKTRLSILHTATGGRKMSQPAQASLKKTWLAAPPIL